jgi:hypothetical protein
MSSGGRVPLETRTRPAKMMSCDYNGWNDAPEDEREWFDQHPEIWAAPVPARRGGTEARHAPRPRHRGGVAA